MNIIARHAPDVTALIEALEKIIAYEWDTNDEYVEYVHDSGVRAVETIADKALADYRSKVQ